jgi:hypothetical protein
MKVSLIFLNFVTFFVENVATMVKLVSALSQREHEVCTRTREKGCKTTVCK